ncbi:MAG: transglutaminase family protein [Saprospiraceae bacterium]|nr:transglutaminase family protein [Saprospiraceae bacterium]
MPSYRIQHITRYSYPSPVIDGVNQIMLFPIQDALQKVENQELTITESPVIEEFVDYYNNKIGIFSLVQSHQELVIQSNVEVITQPVVFPEDQQPAAEQWQHLRTIDETYPYMDFLKQERFNAKDEILKVIGTTSEETPLVVAQRLSKYINEHFEYRKGVTSVETDIDEIWNLKAGVCQDFAHILLVMLHTAGIPARYVSGYICPKDHELRGEGATHAWVEAYIPFYGWLGIDPTNDCLVSDGHVRLAVGRNFSDCTPVKGTYKGSGEHTLEVSVTIENGIVRPKSQEPPPTFGYTVKKEDVPISNSYRQFMEMQMQQQQ